MGKRTKTSYPGVYQRAGEKRKYSNKPDVCFDIYYDVRGKKRWEKVGWMSEGYNAKSAAIIRAERIRQIRHGEDLPQDKKKYPLFKDAAKRYLDWAKDNKTRSGYDEGIRYRNHLSAHFNGKRLDEITSFHIEQLKQKLVQKELAPATVKHCLVLFREIFNKAINWYSLDISNPIKGVKMPSVQNTRLRFFTHEEANLLLDALEPYKQLHDMALLSLRTGLRFKEITGIKGRDIDFNNGIVNIMDPKNAENNSHVYLASDIKAILREYNTPPSEYLFRNSKGERIKEITDTFERVIERLKFNDGIEDRRQRLTFHSLRHTFASWLALNGEQLKTIQELMRHKTIQMTMKYAHLIPDHKMKAVEALSEDH